MGDSFLVNLNSHAIDRPVVIGPKDHPHVRRSSDKLIGVQGHCVAGCCVWIYGSLSVVPHAICLHEILGDSYWLIDKLLVANKSLLTQAAVIEEVKKRRRKKVAHAKSTDHVKVSASSGRTAGRGSASDKIPLMRLDDDT
ncbi:hypothetical protein HD806DRAFT_391549 [Xylariaceae sp. AK1471]|nr:hypothetical protein HD806DRAFT_391549 [Xylariaceae sp. AK1471]